MIILSKHLEETVSSIERGISSATDLSSVLLITPAAASSRIGQLMEKGLLEKMKKKLNGKIEYKYIGGEHRAKDTSDPLILNDEYFEIASIIKAGNVRFPEIKKQTDNPRASSIVMGLRERGIVSMDEKKRYSLTGKLYRLGKNKYKPVSKKPEIKTEACDMMIAMKSPNNNRPLGTPLWQM